MRLFVALNFEEKIRNRLYLGAQELRRHSVQARISHKDNLHLTLAFIGETNCTEQAKEALDSIKEKAFELNLGGYGEFFRREGSICYVHAQGGKTLQNLATAVRDSLTSRGFEIDRKPFRAHITLARQFIPTRDFDEEKINELIGSHKVLVSAISLMKSERINGRLTYTEIHRKTLI